MMWLVFTGSRIELLDGCQGVRMILMRTLHPRHFVKHVIVASTYAHKAILAVSALGGVKMG